MDELDDFFDNFEERAEPAEDGLFVDDIISHEAAFGVREPLTWHQKWVLSFLLSEHFNSIKPVAHRMFLAVDLQANFKTFMPSGAFWSERSMQCHMGILLRQWMPGIVRKTIGGARRVVYCIPEDAIETTLKVLGRTRAQAEKDLWDI